MARLVQSGNPRAFVDIHVISERTETIERIEGLSYWLNDKDEIGELVCVGDSLHRDDRILVMAGGMVEYRRGRIVGGRRGRTHFFVDPESIREVPTRADVPGLLAELEGLQKQFDVDPFQKEYTLERDLDVICSREFAMTNLDLVAARGMPELLARSLSAVCLFYNGESACVAMSQINLGQIYSTIKALERPINPHLVDVDTLRILLDKVYTRGEAKKV